MSQSRPFSKLKKQLEALFVPELPLRIDCFVHANRTQRSVLNVPRYTVTLNKEMIWDFPTNFPLKKETPHLWPQIADISALIRDYIDAPLDGLTEQVFHKEHVNFSYKFLGNDRIDDYDFNLRLTPLLIAADRRLGKDRLLTWATRWPADSPVHRVLAARFATTTIEPSSGR